MGSGYLAVPDVKAQTRALTAAQFLQRRDMQPDLFDFVVVCHDWGGAVAYFCVSQWCHNVWAQLAQQVLVLRYRTNKEYPRQDNSRVRLIGVVESQNSAYHDTALPTDVSTDVVTMFSINRRKYNFKSRNNNKCILTSSYMLPKAAACCQQDWTCSDYISWCNEASSALLAFVLCILRKWLKQCSRVPNERAILFLSQLRKLYVVFGGMTTLTFPLPG